MKLPISWLRELVAVDGSPEVIAEALTTRGFYVVDWAWTRPPLPGLLVARIDAIRPHPGADRLRLVTVDLGGRSLEIVCGAPELELGWLVALAPVGSVLPSGLRIRESKIRGVVSPGMLCSETELGRTSEGGGLFRVPTSGGSVPSTPGAALDSVLGPSDAVLDVETPFNRPDGLGVMGLAREVKAALAGSWQPGAVDLMLAAPVPDQRFPLQNLAPEACTSIYAQEISGIRVGPSPDWLVARLALMGQRSVNNIVDITNFVLFELGHPMHAFDLNKLEGRELRVRWATPGERITTLDGTARTLSEQVLVLADASRALDIAGVMGGLDCEVKASTRTILLTCAHFDARCVRRSSQAQGLRTEAARRYERGVDSELGPRAVARFDALLAHVAPDARIERSAFQSTPPVARVMRLRASRCERLIGIPLQSERCAELLAGLEFGVRESAGELDVTIPSWRPDCTVEADLVEEVARANGYDRIPENPIRSSGAYARRSPVERCVRAARDAMVALGIDEAITSSLVSEAENAQSAALLDRQAAHLRLLNPMSKEGEWLRGDLVTGLLRATSLNLRQRAGAVRLFEVGRVFADTSGPLPVESLQIAAVLSGKRLAHTHDPAPASPKDAFDPSGAVDFLDAKGMAQAWLARMQAGESGWHPHASRFWRGAGGARISHAGKPIGWLGELSAAFLSTWEIDQPVFLFVVEMESLIQSSVEVRTATPLPRYPAVHRDVAFHVPHQVLSGEVEHSILASGGESLRSVDLFDHYRGSSSPAGTRSLAYRLVFQDLTRTLTESEISERLERIVKSVSTQHQAQLRDRT
ncbi:MAG: phenylalanine--tRNA ligase subunit beta [Candidatus Eisenbacteria bacterium]|uniref:Phenylalanine--tRNA ligase beta subunit n=1 Tax=Eiseniibacteriota bacterium TaxID=2212470 RepID=A0A849SIC3_UNCEI|nr:phenylalanine--tRNA ligase subunit beta [Candidatus Eisenbacteria bacterium]